MIYPIGQQDFQSLREEGKVYIDKTETIYKLVNNSKYVFLSRPRRFGKSLLLSTIKAFFEGKKELFKDLKVEKLEKDWHSHPVLHLSLNGINPSDDDSLNSILEQQFRIWEKNFNVKEPLKSFGVRFGDIIRHAFYQTQQKVVILIDEYDNPLINTMHLPELQEKFRNLLKSIYSNLKDLDVFIRFAMLTGVSRFSKMTIFSGINNLNDISFDNQYSDICGFTYQEIIDNLKPGIEHLASELDSSYFEAVQKLAEWYDGYHFSEKSPDIYNPFSLLNALVKGKVSAYWLETATPEFLVKKLKDSHEVLSEVFHSSADQTELAASDTSFSSPVALLYQTGYLTIKEYNPVADSYILGIPNLEVKKGFLPTLLSQFIGKDRAKTRKDVEYIKQYLLEGDVDKFIEVLAIFIGSIPYNIMPKISEKFFQNTLYLIFSVMGLEVESEKHHSFGRSDIIVKTDKYVYIFELKIDKSAQEALTQIEEKQYALPYQNSGKKIFKIGINFSSKTRNIYDWIIK